MRPFREHLNAACPHNAAAAAADVDDTCVAAFTSLGGDSRLVAPVAPAVDLARFVRAASDAQASSLWRRVGDELAAAVDGGDFARLYLSTSGLGVSWLHVRIDPRPKYYTHMPFIRRRP